MKLHLLQTKVETAVCCLTAAGEGVILEAHFPFPGKEQQEDNKDIWSAHIVAF